MGLFATTRNEQTTANRSDNLNNRAVHQEDRSGILRSGLDLEADRALQGHRSAPPDNELGQLMSPPRGLRAAIERSNERRSTATEVGEGVPTLVDFFSAQSYLATKISVAAVGTVVGYALSVYAPAVIGAGAMLGWGADKAVEPVFAMVRNVPLVGTLAKSEFLEKQLDRVARWFFSPNENGVKELNKVGRFLLDDKYVGAQVVCSMAFGIAGITSGGLLGTLALASAGAVAYFMVKPSPDKPLAPRAAGMTAIAGVGMLGAGLFTSGLGVVAAGIGYLAARAYLGKENKEKLNSVK